MVQVMQRYSQETSHALMSNRGSANVGPLQLGQGNGVECYGGEELYIALAGAWILTATNSLTLWLQCVVHFGIKLD